MQASAAGAGTIPGVGSTERRPVRLLVPKARTTMWYVPEVDTLRAYDLGLTRDTDDGELAGMIRPAAQMLRSAGLTEDPEAYLRRIRDGLRHPRDVEEAYAWDMIVPEDQNKEEFEADPRKRTGWYWVLDPTRSETQPERQARLLADRRMIDMKGAARILQRTYITTKDHKVESDRVRKVLRDPEFLRAEALKRVERALAKDIHLDIDTAVAEELAYAKKFVVKAMPARRARHGQSDVWYVSDICETGRATTRLDEWYEYNRVRQTGRPVGSRTRRRTRTATPAGEDAHR
jgi:hypothetical protein